MIDEMVLKAMDQGYDATALMVEGTRHGVPQRRPRFFLVLSKYRIGWQPTGIRSTPTVGAAFAKPFKSFTCTKEGSKFFLALIRKTKQGQRAAAKFNELYPERVAEGERTGEWVEGRPSFQNIRLDPNQPSCTLTGGAKQIHPIEHRLISVEESAELCGYPRTFKFLGSIGKQYQQVAQAVMPPVGEYLAARVAEALKTKARVSKPEFRRIEIFNDTVDYQPLEAHDAKWWASNSGIVVPAGVVKSDKGEKANRAKIRAQVDRGERPAKVRAVEKPAKVRAEKPINRKPLGHNPRPQVGSGVRIRELLVKGWQPDRILEKIHKEFPTSRATRSDVSWNRRKLRLEGVET